MMKDSPEFQQAVAEVEAQRLEQTNPDDWYIRTTNANRPYLQIKPGKKKPAEMVKREQETDKKLAVTAQSLGLPAAHEWDFSDPEQRKAYLQQRAFAKKLTESSFQQGYQACAAEYAELIVLIEQKYLMDGLTLDASDADKRLAWQVVKDMKDRLGGKPKQTIEMSDPGDQSFVLDIADAAIEEVDVLEEYPMASGDE